MWQVICECKNSRSTIIIFVPYTKFFSYSNSYYDCNNSVMKINQNHLHALNAEWKSISCECLRYITEFLLKQY